MQVYTNSDPYNRLLQQKILDTFVEWTTERLIDEIYLSLTAVKVQFCMITNGKTTPFSDPIQEEHHNKCNNGQGVLRRIYEEQARYKMYRMVIYRPSPAFIIHLKDLDEKIKRELAKCSKESSNFILKQAAERIFEQVDNRYFLLSAKKYLKVRLER